jgi:hypothetical protein
MSVALLAATVGAGSAHAGPSGGALPPQLIQILGVAGRYGVPADAAMVAVNVTVSNPAEPGFVTVFACDEDEPPTSNVNYLADQVVPNLVMSRVSSDGTICVATSAVTDAIVDIVGYVPGGSAVVPLAAPVRRLDTREPGGPPSPVPAGTTTEIQITGLDGIPADATLVMFNATAIGGVDPGFVTAYPCGDLPGTSSVNHLANQIVANFVTSRISAAGTICLFNLAAADIIVDVVAYATGGITPLATPQRIVDTRLGGSGPQPQAGTLTLDIASRADVPDDASAAVYNLTSVEASGPGFATSYPCDVALPGVSNLNYAAGQAVANGAITKLSSGGDLCIFNLAPTHLIVDLIGYTRGADDYVPITPQRIWDSREGWQARCNWVLRQGFGFLEPYVLTALNLTSGARAELPLPPPVLRGAPDLMPIVSSDCSGVWVLRQELFHLGFDGSVRRSPIASTVNWQSGDLKELPDGRLVVAQDRRVVDVRTGAVLAENIVPEEVTPPGHTWMYLKSMAIDGAGRFVAAAYVNPGQTDPKSFITVRRLDGSVVWEGLIDGDAMRLELSPTGRYFVVDTMRALDENQVVDDSVSSVFTLFGDEVDVVFAYDSSLGTEFLGNGELALCASRIGLFTWQLYGPFRLVADQTDPWFGPTRSIGIYCGIIGA